MIFLVTCNNLGINAIVRKQELYFILIRIVEIFIVGGFFMSPTNRETASFYISSSLLTSKAVLRIAFRINEP